MTPREVGLASRPAALAPSMRPFSKEWILGLLHRRGFGVTPYPVTRLLRTAAPDVVLDVGANAGQFGQELRRLGYRGRIVSFEPQPEAFRALTAAARTDGAWEVHNLALGAADGETALHVASNSYSTSLLAPAAALAAAAPQIAFERGAAVPVRRLDGLFGALCRPGERVFLKVDTQGYEQAVLEGAGDALGHIAAVQLELSFVPFYEGEPPAEEVMGWLRARGFAPAWLYPAFWEPGTRRWYQADVLFLQDALGGAALPGRDA